MSLPIYFTLGISEQKILKTSKKTLPLSRHQAITIKEHERKNISA